jgi:hypothetical protein
VKPDLKEIKNRAVSQLKEGDERKKSDSLKEVIERLEKYQDSLNKKDVEVSNMIQKLYELFTEFRFPEEMQVWVRNRAKMQDVKVANLKEIKIPEQKEYPNKIDVSNLKEVTTKLDSLKKDLLKEFSKQRNDDRVMIKNRNEREAIPVVLTDKTRKKFYDAVTAAFGSFNSFNLTNDGNLKVSLEEMNQGNLIGGIPITFSDSASTDAFGRLRVSNPKTLFDSKQIFDDADIANSAENQPLFFDNQETSGGGTTTTFTPNSSATSINVGATTAGTRVRQTKMRFNYQPGKSQLIFNTFVMGAQASGITKREGLYDENDGVFLEDNGSEYRFVRRTSTSGSPVDNVISQANWNLDTMDGNGASGINLDFTKTQILITDFEWLGVGRVRIGFVIDGLVYYAHEFLNTNNLAVVYMQTPNLPLRSEISNDGTGVASSLIQICSSVISEGGQDVAGKLHTHNNGTTAVGLTTGGTKYALLGIKLRSSHLGMTVDLRNINLLATAAVNFLWTIELNPTLSAGLTYANKSNSGVQVAVGTNQTVTSPGYIIDSGYVVGSRSAANPLQSALFNAIKLGSLIDGTPDELIVTATPFGNSGGAVAAIQWNELS